MVPKVITVVEGIIQVIHSFVDFYKISMCFGEKKSRPLLSIRENACLKPSCIVFTLQRLLPVSEEFK